MSIKITLQEILEVQQYFGLPSPALVEKDFHVVQALSAILALDLKPVRLVFGGGTSLSRAHRCIRRMSEDIDLRIVSDEKLSRDELRKLRDEITAALLAAGFQFDPKNDANRLSRNSSQYTLYRLPYAPQLKGIGTLRPEIQIETALFPLRLATKDLPVSSFVAEAFKRPPELPSVACVSILETLADKFVALTRRVGSDSHKPESGRDPDLVRHVYDLHVTRPHQNSAQIGPLISEIMLADAEAHGNEFPAYKDSPIAETLKAIESLASDQFYVGHYEQFQRSMVYGERVGYGDCIDTIRALAECLSTN